ncbi:MAG: ester cyclase [Thermomicrobiales bacterium]
MDRSHPQEWSPARDPDVEAGRTPSPGDPVTAHLDALAGGDGTDLGTDLGTGLAAGVTLDLVQTGEVVLGHEAVTVVFAELHRQAFRARTTVRSRTVQGDQTVVEATFSGRHVAEFAGIPPMGTEVTVPYVLAYETVGETIVAIRAYLPFGELIRQLRGEGA